MYICKNKIVYTRYCMFIYDGIKYIEKNNIALIIFGNDHMIVKKKV